jgi:hypothetical protein
VRDLHEKHLMMDVIKKDVAFLLGTNVLDYSILYRADSGSWAGIIDILTPYTKRKIVEHYVKGTVRGLDVSLIIIYALSSCMY